MIELAAIDSRGNPAEARRVRLLALGWPTSIEAEKRATKNPSNTGQWAKDAREGGRLLGIWDDVQHTYRHPDFQFAADGSIRPEVQELLAVMAEHPDWTPRSDPNGWRRTYWLYQPFRSLSRRANAFARAYPLGVDHALHGSPEGALAMISQWIETATRRDAQARNPAEVFAEDPQAVIELASKMAAMARSDP